MKKTGLIASFMAVALLSAGVGAYAASDIKLFINGKTVDAPVEIIEGSSYVPLRVVSEALGADVKWDGDARTISITGGAAPGAVSVKPDVKSYVVNILIENGPMRMKIAKVTLDPAYKAKTYSDAVNAIVMDVSVENTSENKVTWRPEGSGGKLVLNTKEQVESGSIFHSDNVGGEFVGKVIKSGKIVFEVKGNLKDVTSLNYVLDSPYNSDTYKAIGTEKTTEIIFK
jgi:hypothetical protein